MPVRPEMRSAAILRALYLLAAAAVGLFAGAMLTEAGVLVPYWRSLGAAEFYAWYAANDERLFSFFGSLTVAALVLALLAAIVSLRQRAQSRRLWAASAALMLACVLMFPLYFEAANASFSAATLSDGELSKELARWASWHSVRTFLSSVAFVLALRACCLR
ncbi:MAG TPA: DUF1772 domain-containing protein [Candidatus Limnocylindrales bacterium]|nr:DUF1772 domain-containing protein [Candidatus Limnocylindrales bacterium]